MTTTTTGVTTRRAHYFTVVAQSTYVDARTSRVFLALEAASEDARVTHTA